MNQGVIVARDGDVAFPEEKIATARIDNSAEQRAERCLLHVAVARAGEAAGVERKLHQSRTVDPKRGPAAPEIWHMQECFGDRDRVGRRPVLLTSLTASALAYLWLGGATALWMLFAARGFAGACAGNIAAAQAYMADVTGPEQRARGMGLIGAAFGLGFIIGPALGGVIAGNDPATADVQTPAWIAAGLSLLAFLGVAGLCFAAFFVLREQSPRPLRIRMTAGQEEGTRHHIAESLRQEAARKLG